MYREIKTITNSYDKKALFSRGTSSSLHTIVFLSYSDISRCYLFNKPKSNCLIQATYYKVSTHRQYDRAITQDTHFMTYTCTTCGGDVHHKRIELGITTCLTCGERQAKERKHCIVPMHKSNYIVVTNHDDLVRINNKSG